MSFFRHSYALTGIKHVGKTTIGKGLAQFLEAEFLDLDDLLVRRAVHQGLIPPDRGKEPPIRSVYRTIGAEAFSQWELESLQDLPSIVHNKRLVLATGGGICEHEKSMEILARIFGILYLFDNPHALYERAVRSGIPAFLDPARPKAHFLEIAERRDDLYRRYADRVIDISGMDRHTSLQHVQEQVR